MNCAKGELPETGGSVTASLLAADPEAALSEALAELVASRLLLRDDQRYLTLAVSVDFQLDVLARRHMQNQSLTRPMAQARARLFDPRMPALTAAFAARMVATSEVLHGW